MAAEIFYLGGVMDTIQLLWPVITGSITVPIGQWIKGRLPGDLPIRSTIIVAILNLLAMGLAWQLFVPDMLFKELIPLALAAQVTGQFVHAGVKTKKKVR